MPSYDITLAPRHPGARRAAWPRPPATSTSTAPPTEGLDGTGVRAAVIDSGIDFTHVDLGGPGTAAAYTACYGTPPGPGVPEAGQPRNVAPDRRLRQPVRPRRARR